jgi:hypothetical protein
MATTAWVAFVRQRFEDARRRLYGRRGEKDPAGRVEAVLSDEGDEYIDPIDGVDGSSAVWHVMLRESNLPWLEDFIQQTADEISDPLIRYVAIDQFGNDPSPISAGKSAGGKRPLTEQLGLDRYQISRALRAAKARLAAALMAQKERELNADWLREFVKR